MGMLSGSKFTADEEEMEYYTLEEPHEAYNLDGESTPEQDTNSKESQDFNKKLYGLEEELFNLDINVQRA